MNGHSIHIYKSLSIFILQDGFSFLILDEHQIPLEHKAFQLPFMSSISQLLTLIKRYINTTFMEREHIQSVDVIYGNSQFTIVPQDFFDQNYLPHYLKYSSQLVEGDDFAFDEIPLAKANAVYIPYVNINNYLFHVFGTFTFTHLFTGLIEKGFINSKTTDEYLLLHSTKHMFYLAAYKNEQLILSNAFTFETAEDFVYYTLSTIRELKLNREELVLDFTGDFDKSEDNKAYQILSNYIKTMEFSNKKTPHLFENQLRFNEHYNLI
jgi:hypothetical protein